MSELLDKQVNAQKEKTSGVHASSRKPTKKVCDENERNKEKKRRTRKNIIDGFYRVSMKNSCHGYQPASTRRLLIQ